MIKRPDPFTSFFPPSLPQCIPQLILILFLQLYPFSPLFLPADQAFAARTTTDSSPWQKAVVVNPDSQIYAEADFDAKVVGTLKAGTLLEVSKNIYGPFYRVKVAEHGGAREKGGAAAAKATYKYISEIDVRSPEGRPLIALGSAPKGIFDKKGDKARKPASDSPEEGALRPDGSKNPGANPPGAETRASEEKKSSDSEKEAASKDKPFHRKRYQGLTYEGLRFTEDTMGSTYTANIPWIGWKITGPNTLVAGPVDTDFVLEFAHGAPPYYAQVTGQTAEGAALNLQMMFDSVFPQSRFHSAVFGFGTFFRYSHFEVQVKDAGTSAIRVYALEDMVIGGVLKLGLAFRLSRSWALRLDGKYFFDRARYYGLGVSLQHEF